MEFFNDVYDSPIGYLALKATTTHLTELKFVEKKGKVFHRNKITDETILQLNLYFNNELKQFSLPIQPTGSDFRIKVWSVLEKIQFGELKSYKDVAKELGSIKSVRAVGLANGDNPIVIIIPCHRVIGSNNSIVGYGGGIWRKRWLIDHENAGMQQTLFDSVNYL